MRYLSVCSGIEAATVAWHPLGFEPVAYSEIEPFPSAVLSSRWPAVPNLGDLTNFKNWPDYAIDLLVGGTPCQGFSVAGLRGGLADPRGNLTLTFLALAERYRPQWVCWENVPGVFSCLSNGAGNPTPPPPPMDLERDGQRVETRDEYRGEELHAFGCFLAGLSKLGYGWSYRVLNTEHFGVPQRRRRVFVVGCLGDWRRAASVLFERYCLQGHHPPRRKTGESIAGTLGKSFARRGYDDRGDTGGVLPIVVPAVTSKWSKGSGGPAGDECQNLVAFDTTQITNPENRCQPKAGDPCHPLTASGHPPAIAFRAAGQDGFDPSEVSPPIVATDGGGTVPTVFGFDSMNCGKTQHGYTEDGSPPIVADGGGGRTCVGFTIHGTDKTAKAVSYSETALALTARPPGSIQNSATTAVLDLGNIAMTEPQIFQTRVGRNDRGMPEPVAPALNGTNAGDSSDSRPVLLHGSFVRRLTPLECERLQGFPDNYTLIDGASDNARYRAIGNSMPVPVMSWLGKRIQQRA